MRRAATVPPGPASASVSDEYVKKQNRVLRIAPPSHTQSSLRELHEERQIVGHPLQQTLFFGSRYERTNDAYSVRRRQPLLHRVWPCSCAAAPLSETTRTDTQGAGHVDTRGVYEPEVFQVSVSAGALEDYQLLKKRARGEFGGSSRRRLLSRDAPRRHQGDSWRPPLPFLSWQRRPEKTSFFH